MYILNCYSNKESIQIREFVIMTVLKNLIGCTKNILNINQDQNFMESRTFNDNEKDKLRI